MENFNDLAAFALVASEHSFTRAAAKMGVSQSALSQTIRQLEARLGLRLLDRTTRSVSPTQAGEQLLKTLAPRLEEIENALSSLKALREKPAGTVRINAGEHSAATLLEPRLRKVIAENPDIRIEIAADYGLMDIVAQRFDAGVRLGEQVARDMIAVRIGPDIRMAVVGAPDYFRRFAPPQTPHDLTAHNCINMRLPTHGGLLPWEFSKDGRDLNVRVTGQLIFNNLALRLNAALAGSGLACLPEDSVREAVARGELIAVLQAWCPYMSGYHLYYPDRRHPSPAFARVIEALRWRDE
ncbi:HTH-type transcriptional regulator PgrR [Mixta theicola]|nr:LysR family transcriptional regulator [Mixta theicola]QHM74484.1 HTH-type transcriptional regulator PgrR [Mixta theicola]